MKVVSELELECLKEIADELKDKNHDHWAFLNGLHSVLSKYENHTL